MRASCHQGNEKFGRWRGDARSEEGLGRQGKQGAPPPSLDAEIPRGREAARQLCSSPLVRLKLMELPALLRVIPFLLVVPKKKKKEERE